MPMPRRCTGTFSTRSPSKLMAPASGIDEAGDGAQQRGLADPDGPSRPKNSPSLKVIADIVERRERAIALADVADIDPAHLAFPAELVECARRAACRPMDTRMMMVEMALISGVKPLRIAE